MRFCVEIINRSSVDVTISEVGVQSRGTRRRSVITHPDVYDQKPWPRRLQPRESFVIYTQLHGPRLAHVLERAKHVYALTDCDERFTGKSSIFKEIVREFAKID